MYVMWIEQNKPCMHEALHEGRKEGVACSPRKLQTPILEPDVITPSSFLVGPAVRRPFI